MPFTAIVVDDEPLARDELKYLLSAHPNCHVVGEAENAAEALRLVAERRPDVVFLDIDMPGMTGSEAARAMLAGPNPPLIIFATAYGEYALTAFELGAVDYILKPFEERRLATTIERIESLRRRSADWEAAVERVASILGASRPKVRKLPVERRGEIRLIDYDNIVYAEAREGAVAVVTQGETFTYHGTLAELEARLSLEGFMRVHRSYLVNLDRVEGILPWFKGTYWLVMGDGKHTQVPVSKSLVKELKHRLGIDGV